MKRICIPAPRQKPVKYNTLVYKWTTHLYTTSVVPSQMKRLLWLTTHCKSGVLLEIENGKGKSSQNKATLTDYLLSNYISAS